MSTWNDLFDAALVELGVNAPGDAGSSTDRTYCLGVTNRLLSSWSVEIRPIFFETTESLTWASGNASRTIGTGGNLDTTRPEKVLGVQWRDSSNVDFPLDLYTHQEYQGIVDKTLSGDPLVIAYNPTIASGFGTLFAWPVPSSAFTLRLTSYKPFTTITDQTATVVLSSGYEAALVYNLAVLISSAYGRDPSAFTEREARKTKGAITRANIVPQPMSPDPMAPGAGTADSIRLWTRP